MLFGFPFDASGTATSAVSPFIGAQAGADDLYITPGAAAYPAANATVYRVYEYAVPVTTVATVPSAYPFGSFPGGWGGGGFGGGFPGAFGAAVPPGVGAGAGPFGAGAGAPPGIGTAAGPGFAV